MVTIASCRLSQHTTSRHSRQRVVSAGPRRTGGGSLPRRLGAAVLVATSIMAMGAALAVPASAESPIVGASNGGNGVIRLLSGPRPGPPATPAPVETTTTVTANPSQSNQNDLVVYTARVQLVSTDSPFQSFPGGTVTFWVGTTHLCNHPLPLEPDPGPGRLAGMAKCKSSIVPVGTHTVTAIYSGTDKAKSSRGAATETVSVRAAPLDTTTTVTADPPTFTEGGLVTYLATVRPVSGRSIPTGTVTFTVGDPTHPLCTAAVPLNGVGNAKCQSIRAPVGADIVIARYSGDAGFNPSQGSTKETISARNAATKPGS